MVRTVPRKVYFFKMSLTKGGRKVSAKDVFCKLQNLPCDYQGRMMQISDAKDVHLYVESSEWPIKARLSNYKKHDWPTAAIQDRRFPLNVPDGGSICEATHFVVFNNGVVGMEYNQYAPRQGSLARFTELKAPDLVEEVDFDALIDKELVESLILAQERGIRLMRLRVLRGTKNVVEALQGQLGMTLSALEDVSPNSPDYEIIIRPSRNENMKIPFLPKIVPWLQKDKTKDAINSKKIKTFEIDYNSEDSVESLDLLQPYVMARKKVIREDDDTRAINSQSMYDAIVEAHDELKEAISSSLT
jgi:hypothetical protein